MKQPQPKGKLSTFKITAIYAVAGGLWILFSDRMLALFIEDPHILTQFQAYKGWLFVAVTATLLYWLIRRYASEIKRSEDILRRSEKSYRTLLENLPQKIFFKDKISVFFLRGVKWQ